MAKAKKKVAKKKGAKKKGAKKGAEKKGAEKKGAEKKGAEKKGAEKKGAKKKVAKKKGAKKKGAEKKVAKKKGAEKKGAEKKGAEKKGAEKKVAKKKAAPKKTASKNAETKAQNTVDHYIAELQGWQRLVAQMLRHSVRRAAPDAKESIKWAQPVYEDHGPFAYFKAFGNTLNFGFWRGAEMADPHGLLKGEGDRMRHVTMHGPEDLQPKYLEELIREAVALNRAKGDPTERE